MVVLGGVALPMSLACGPVVGPAVFDPDDDASSSGDVDPSGAVTIASAADSTGPMEPSDPSDTASTGEPPLDCGDAVLDAGEECDDGNAETLDGCEVDCRFSPGTLLWHRSIDGGAGLSDFASSVALGATGIIYVAGTTQSKSSRDAWLGVFDLEGETVRTASFDLGGDEAANTVVLDTSGAVFVVAQSLADDSALLLRDDEGTLTQVGNGGSHDPPWPTRGAVSPVGGFFTLRQEWALDDVQHWGYALDLRDELGTPVWTAREGAGAMVSAMVGTAEGGVVLAGRLEDEAGYMRVWLREHASDGSVSWSFGEDFVDYEDESFDAVMIAGDGTVVVGGQQEIPSFGYVPFVARFDRSGALTDLREVAIGSASFTLHAVIEDADGFVLGGAAYPANTPSDAVVAAIDGEGMLRWGSSYDNLLGFNDSVNAIARDPVSGDVIVVGRDVASGESDNVWLARIRG